VLAKIEYEQPLGFIGKYLDANFDIGWLKPSRKETVLATVNPSKRGDANGDLIIGSTWRPSSGTLNPDWTYAASLVTYVPGSGETVLSSLSVDAFDDLDPLCAVVLGSLLTARDTAIFILDTIALTDSVLSVATGELPEPFRKSARGLGLAGDASFAIKFVSARYNNGRLDQVIVEYGIGKTAEMLANNPTRRASLAAAEATKLAEFLYLQGATNGEYVFDTCMT
jgi:hypothetical protein